MDENAELDAALQAEFVEEERRRLTPILHVTGWDGPHDEKTRAIPLLPGLYGFSGTND